MKLSPQALAKEMNRALGSGTIRFGDDPSLRVTYLPTGIAPIDALLHGGLPRGRTTEIFGDWSTLKSYIALCAIAETQRSGGVCALVDTEGTYNPAWAEELGVDTKNLLLPPTKSGEEAVDATETLIANDVDLIVWDSVAATLTRPEAATRLKTNTPQLARLAALMSLAMRKLTTANNNKTALLFINQIRMNVGITFGNPETTPGGKALGFYSTYRICVKKAGKITQPYQQYHEGKKIEGKQQVGQKIRATVEKSKLNRPYRDVMFTFDLRTGTIDEIGYLIDVGLAEGRITQGGAGTWKMGRKTGRGINTLRELVKTNPAVKQDLCILAGVPMTKSPAKKRVVRLKRK